MIKDILTRTIIGLTISTLLFLMWRGGVWLESLTTIRTPLYYTIHEYASAIICPLVGIAVGVLYEK